VVQATGTGLVCTGFAQTTDTRRDSQRPVEANKDGEGGNTTGLNPLTGEGVEASCDPVSPGEVSIPDRSRTCNLRLRRPPRRSATSRFLQSTYAVTTNTSVRPWPAIFYMVFDAMSCIL